MFNDGGSGSPNHLTDFDSIHPTCVCTQELDVEKASASTPQVAHRDLHSPRPSTRRRSRPTSPLRGVASMLQFDATKPTWQAKAHANKVGVVYTYT
eukprot:1150961-Pelagomonas_calceolata.AAC.5